MAWLLMVCTWMGWSLVPAILPLSLLGDLESPPS